MMDSSRYFYTAIFALPNVDRVNNSEFKSTVWTLT